METKQYTATVGEETIPCTAREWLVIAARATERGEKAYLVETKTNRVVQEG